MWGEVGLTCAVEFPILPFMSKILRIAYKFQLLQLIPVIEVTDASGTVLYRSTFKFALFNPTWTLTKGGNELATLKRKFSLFGPTWNVSTHDGDFQLIGKMFTLHNRTVVRGGPFDGSVLTTSIFGRNVNLVGAGGTIAKARAKLLSILSRCDIELLDESPHAELLTVILMTKLLIDSDDEYQDHGFSVRNDITANVGQFRL